MRSVLWWPPRSMERAPAFSNLRRTSAPIFRFPAWVNADRLTRIVAAQDSSRVRALWSALAYWQEKDRRFARLAKLHTAGRIDLLAAGTDFQLRRHGEDARFAGGPLRVPANLLRDRAADVEPPADLSRHHHAYRHRVMIGPTYRADMWAALEADPTLSAAALARQTYGSFATAWHVRRDFALPAASQPAPGRCPVPRGRSAAR
jgi:hypothetical protein